MKTKSFIRIAFIAITILFLPQTIFAQSKADDYFQQGIMLANQGKLEEAIVAWEKSYEEGPAIGALYNIAQAYINLEKLSQAVVYFHKCIDDADRYKKYFEKNGWDYTMPEDMLEQYIDAHYCIARCYEETGSDNLAIDFYFKTIALAPENADYHHAYFFLGIRMRAVGENLVNSGKKEEGKELLDRAELFINKAAAIGDEEAKRFLNKNNDTPVQQKSKGQSGNAQSKTKSQGGLRKDPNFKIK
jgi:tetratricopeptide (TPR) repeat protein